MFFLKVTIRNIYLKLQSKSRSRFQKRAYFWDIFPGKNLRYAIHYEFWYLHEMKA